MRCLERNKIKLWLVEKTGKLPVVDSEGFETGESTTQYSVPQIIYIGLQPATGNIVERIFGKDVSLDMLSSTTDVILTKDSLLFLSEPVSNYGTTYDYSISAINKSLNGYTYGLKERT